MKPFLTLSLVAAISFFIDEPGVRAQATQSPTVTQPDETKLLHKQRDSAASRETRSPSGVQARRKPNGAPTSPDTSYNTIVNTPPNTSGTSATQSPGGANVPESMRIQQETVRTLPPRHDLITKGAPSGEAPGVANSSVERNRIDSAAPSRQRLQVDDLSAVRPQQPNSNSTLAPSTEPTVRGSASGSSSGTSGQGVTGSPAPSTSPSRSTGASAGASTGSHPSAGVSSGGSH
jgi:hypothetical protein